MRSICSWKVEGYSRQETNMGENSRKLHFQPHQRTRHHSALSNSKTLRTAAGIPAASVKGGMFPSTTELAPITDPSPIEDPGVTTTPSPSHTLEPITTLWFRSRGRIVGAICGELCKSPEYWP